MATGAHKPANLAYLLFGSAISKGTFFLVINRHIVEIYKIVMITKLLLFFLEVTAIVGLSYKSIFIVGGPEPG